MSEVKERLSAALADRYTIEDEVGQGGMATVFLAQDIKHERKVAIKVLRPELAAVIGGERFLKEIKVTANLQHPHILPLHDSGEADSFLYYVMPYVEGETLRDKLNREKQFGIEEAVELTRAISGAVDYAHRQDVIHRDIKPENILIHDGQALVSDFGIALAVSSASDTRLTETGLSIGTPHYMSPEQAMGDRELDARSDVYSLGAMLYEMLVGDPPYTGSTAQAIVAKVITEKAPPVTAHRDTVPPNVAAAIEKALAKTPADRFATAADFAEALTNTGFLLPTAVRMAPEASPAGTGPAGGAGRFAWPLVSLALLIAALMGWLRSQPPAPVARFGVAIPEGQSIVDVPGSALAISPDGRRIVYTGPSDDAENQLWVRSVDQLDAVPIPGTDGGWNPSFSPDGESVAFIDWPALRVVSLAGGPPLTLADSVAPLGIGWSSNGKVYFTQAGFGGSSRGLSAVPETGGSPEVVTVPDTATEAASYRFVEVLPDGSGALFTIWRGTLEDADIAFVDFESGETKVILRGVTARYSPTGHIVYTRADGALLAVGFDLKRHEIIGGSVPLLEGVSVTNNGSEFAFSSDGTIVYLSGEEATEELVWFDRDGRETPFDRSLTRNFANMAFSPDGGRLAFSSAEGGNTDLWIYDIAQGIPTRLTFEGGLNDRPFWHPDGRRVSFRSQLGGQRALYIMPADGSGPPELLLEQSTIIQEGWWSRDGNTLVYRIGPAGETARDLFYTQPFADTTRNVFLQTQFDEITPSLSPDGLWVTYASNESGRNEIYVRPFPGPGGRWQVSSGGGEEPRWSNSGREIFYRSANREMVSVQVRTNPTFSLGQRDVLFSDRGIDREIDHIAYDVTPDDQRFIMIRSVGGERALTLVLNWFEELKARTSN